MPYFDFQFDGLEGLMIAMRNAGDIPAEVQKRMVAAQAEVTEKALVFTAGTMLKGEYFEGEVARSVKAGRPRMNRGTATVKIEFKGLIHGNRAAEVAFVNEYGKRKQHARPFIKKAIRESQTPGANEAHKVLDEFLEQKGI